MNMCVKEFFYSSIIFINDQITIFKTQTIDLLSLYSILS